MKNVITLVLTVLLAQLSYSQSMTVHKTDQTTATFQLSQIDSITFTVPGIFTCGDTVNYSGGTYHTVQIGTQCWLKENLNVGTVIQGTDTAKNNGTIEKYCYQNETANCSTYGGLYLWDEAMQYDTTSGTRGICPSGWHMPTFAECETLKTAVGNNGNALKAVGQGTGAGAGTNTSGFSALLAGARVYNGTFTSLGLYGFFRSSMQYNASEASYISLNGGDNIILFTHNSKLLGQSVRCIKD